MELNRYIEHTLLKPTATQEEIETLVRQACENNFLGVCINPNYVKLVKKLTQGTNVKVVTVVNFPLASNTLETVIYQTKEALENGADEIDTVVNLAAIKENDYKKVEYDVKETKKACLNNNLKVILETDLITKDEIQKACLACANAGANFVKTSTGFTKGGVGAKVEDVALMAQTVKPYGLEVKASGGIKTKDGAIKLIEAGATRLGTSSGIELVN